MMRPTRTLRTWRSRIPATPRSSQYPRDARPCDPLADPAGQRRGSCGLHGRANPNTVWQYYKLIGVQATPVNGPPAANASADDLSYYYLANIMVETNQTLAEFHGSVQAPAANPPSRYQNVYLNGATEVPSRWAAAKVVTASRGNHSAGI